MVENLARKDNHVESPSLQQDKLKAIDFKIQYNSIYLQRFKEMSTLITIPDDVLLSTIGQVEEHEECAVKGVLFLESKEKLSIFEKTTLLNFKRRVDSIETYFDENMKYYIEDDQCKCEVHFKQGISNEHLITGMVLGLIGQMQQGIFECSKIVYPDKLPNFNEESSKQKILLCSNAKINKNFEFILPLLDFYVEKVDSIVFIGTIFDMELENWDFSKFERILNRLKGFMYILPGREDPTTHFVPQTKLHQRLFVNSDKIVRLSNPAKIEIGNKRYVFMDYNLILKDLMRYKKGSKPISGLKAIVKSRHLAPCAPDTLPSIPFCGNDPFVLHSCDYLMAGAEYFDYDYLDNKFLMTVPDFDSSKTAVIFNSDKNQFEEVSINYN